MKTVLFDTHPFEREQFERSNKSYGHVINFLEPRLSRGTARLAKGFEAVCSFANDKVDRETLKILKDEGVRLIALRSAGYNHVDLKSAQQLNLPVVRVPAYSPYAVAEHAMTLILALNRKIHKAYHRVREGNFSLNGLVGFDLHGKTIGIVGTGRIGAALVSIASGFGCKILCFDLMPNPELVKRFGVEYVSLNDLYQQAHIISLHVPLTPATKHLINAQALHQMKKGVMLINTGRGALIETPALIHSLKNGQVGFAGLDVYEEEEGIFFEDLSSQILQDDQLARLLTFPNVLITSHQAFLTQEALVNIADTTLKNISDFEEGRFLVNEVRI